MKKADLLRVALLVLLMLSFFMACDKDNPTGPSDGLYPMTWSRVEHYYGGSTGYLTITELFGPKGAKVNKVIPGKYLARGTYNLTGSSFTTGEIDLGFIGSVITSEGGKIAESKTYTITQGQLTGTFEVVQEFFKLQSGPGNPCVSFVVGSTMWDRITLY